MFHAVFTLALARGLVL